MGHSGEYFTLGYPNHIAFSWSTDDDDSHNEVHIYITSSDDGSSVRLVHIIDEQWKYFSNKIYHAWASMLKEMQSILKEKS